MSDRAGRLQQFIADVENAAARFDMLPQEARDKYTREAVEQAYKQFGEGVRERMWYGTMLDDGPYYSEQYRYDREHGLTPVVKFWAKHRPLHAGVDDTKWAAEFNKGPEPWREAWRILYEGNPAVLPHESDPYDEDGYDYTPSIADLVEWREKEDALRAASYHIGMPYEPNERMWAYYREQFALAQQMKPL